MKNIYKSLLLLAVLIGSALQVNAYEYFTIIFKDGTKSDAFYATDVDSIRYSKFDLDDIEYPNWQVQEIWTVDSVYRYPLTSIASLDFIDVNIDNVTNDIERANNVIVPLYAASTSAVELSRHLTNIRKIEGVENAWTDNQSLFVKIRNYGTMTFSYSQGFKSGNASQTNSQMTPRKTTYANNSTNDVTDPHIHIKDVCVYDQTYNNKVVGLKEAKETVYSICNMYGKMGISPDSFTDLKPDFFRDKIFDYDQVLLITHGEYDEDADLHWIYTSEEIHKVGKDKEGLSDFNAACKKFFSKYPLDSARKIAIGTQIEKRNGKDYIVYYSKISDEFIMSAKREFRNPNTQIFNVACQSMKDNHKFAQAFTKGKGAGCYIGYNETNSIGHKAGEDFLRNLLNGYSVERAFNYITPEYRKQYFHLVNNTLNDEWYYKTREDGYESGETWYEEGFETLIDWEVNNKNYTAISPETLPAEYVSSETEMSTKLRGRLKMVDPQYAKSIKFQFIVSETSEMSNAKKYTVEGEYDNKTCYMKLEKNLGYNELNTDKNYYYCAAVMDKDNVLCYGDTILIGKIPYVVKNDNDSTLTFYYDELASKREGRIVEIREGSRNYYFGYSKFTKIIIDSSFINYSPTNLNWWFMNMINLKTIEGFKNLNTTEVKGVRGLFAGCELLVDIDLSCFNTSNVTDMDSLFYNCKSLTSLDVSNFNTSNVTDMGWMFYGCSSLTNLNVSNFDTSNVTDMGWMFYGCSSLTNLNVSNFDTSNVTDMGSMFGRCSSLTSLNVSNFNTSNVTDMGGMFYGCSSLTSLNVSNFDTSNVTDMSSMFGRCSSLTSLNVSNFNTSNVTYMGRMFNGCSSLTSLNLTSFNTSNVTNFLMMFYGCESLQTIYAGNWNVSKCKDSMAMFAECKNLRGGEGTRVGWQSIPHGQFYCPDDSRAAHIDGGVNNPGLFTAK